MFVIHHLIGGGTLRHQLILQPSQSGGHSRILVTQALYDLHDKGLRKRPISLLAVNQRLWVRHHSTGPQQLVRHVISFAQCHTTAHDALHDTPQVLHQHDTERDSNRPQFADRQRLDLLIGAHEAT